MRNALRLSLVVGQMKSSSNKTVVLEGLPPGFIDDLPKEDQQAVQDPVGWASALEWIG